MEGLHLLTSVGSNSWGLAQGPLFLDLLTFQEDTAVTFDWYHPQIASRHTLEEVRQWFVKAHLDIVHEQVDFYGMTVRGRST